MPRFFFLRERNGRNVVWFTSLFVCLKGFRADGLSYQRLEELEALSWLLEWRMKFWLGMVPVWREGKNRLYALAQGFGIACWDRTFGMHFRNICHSHFGYFHVLQHFPAQHLSDIAQTHVDRAGQRVRPFSSPDQPGAAIRSHTICPSHVPCSFCPSPTQPPFQGTPFGFCIPGQKQKRKLEDVICGHDHNGLHLLSPHRGTEHFPGHSSLIFTTGPLWNHHL